jgi:hypothetical protein
MARLACLACLILLVPSSLLAQGTLARTRAGLDGPPPAAPPAASGPAPAPNKSTDPGYSPGFTPGSGEAVGYLVVLAGIVATSPFWGPFALLEDNFSVPAYFPGHPYVLPHTSYLHLDPDGWNPHDDQKADFFDRDYLKKWTVRLAVEEGNDFAGLNRLGGRLFVDTTWRVGLTSNWNWYHEHLSATRDDNALISDHNLTFRFAQSEWMQMHAGLGARLWSDHAGTKTGFNFVYAAEAYPINPLVLTAQVDLGNLDSEFVVHARGTVGVQLRRFEVFTGYDFLRIGSVNLQGPLAGVRFTF